jgi:large subunit ribosomal protein L10e
MFSKPFKYRYKKHVFKTKPLKMCFFLSFMALRKGHCYTPLKRPNTRKSKVKSKSYVKTIPPNKIAKYMMGDVPGFYNNKYPFIISLIVQDAIQLRDNSIEAARQLIHRHLEDKLKGNYFMLLRIYPHHIFRENKMLTGAGADRMQTGMAHSFGQPIGVAARLKDNGKIISVFCNKEQIAIVRNILSDARSKLPGKKRIIIEQVKQI